MRPETVPFPSAFNARGDRVRFSLVASPGAQHLHLPWEERPQPTYDEDQDEYDEDNEEDDGVAIAYR